MSYLVLARKYRPLTFGDIIAQEHVTRTLVNAISSGRISHSYLFSGPRGVGKTSTARLLARAVNCPSPVGQDPCNACDSCRQIIEGRALDVLEIDGASNRGIDEIRDLRERVGYAPSSSRYKVYIIDEVHMLTPEAFNALLKTLEEPPSHVIFIFATTAPHKVPPTILSRCQRFDFKAVAPARMISRLEHVLRAEEIAMPPEVVAMIARKADGAMRDALSLCDQVIAFCDGDYGVERAGQVLGLLDSGLFFELSRLVLERRSAEAVEFIDRLADSGVDLEEFYGELVRHYRNLMVFKLGGREPEVTAVSPAQADRYAELADRMEIGDLVRSLQLILGFEETIKRSGQQKISLELLLVRLTMMEKSINISELISRLEHGADGSGAVRRPAAPPAEHPAAPHRPAAASPGPPPATREPGPAWSSPAAAMPQSPPQPTATGRPAAAAPPPVEPPRKAGPVDLAAIRRDWSRVAELVKARRISLGPIVGSLEPESYQDGLLVLKIGAGQRRDLELLGQPDNRRLVDEVIRGLFGMERLELRIETAPEPRSGNQPARSREEPSAPGAQAIREVGRANPLVGKLNELFDPEVLS